MKTALFASLVLLCSCVTAARERGATGLWDRAAVIHTPKEDRCDNAKSPPRRADCAQAKYLAQVYVHKLAPLDQVCLERSFGGDMDGCPARASVADLGSNQILIEIREANPDTPWFGKEQQQIWFEEGALVDMYLRDHGY